MPSINYDENKVAVIIPVYNVEKYLKQCLNSVIKQTYQNLEIVIIDDGSTDSSRIICEQYKQNDGRINVFHIDNQGLSHARNLGLEKSSAEYIMFVDSDDYIEIDCVEYLMSLIKYYNTDVACCDAFNDFEKKSIPWHQNEDSSMCLGSTQAVEKMFYSENFEDTVWGKIYKRTLFEGIRFPEDRKQAEETSTTYRLLLASEKVAIGNRCKYHYVMHQDGLSRLAYRPQQMLMQVAGKECLEYIKNHYPTLEKSATRRYVYDCFWVLRRIIFAEGSYEQDIAFLINEIKKYALGVFFDNRSKLRDKIAILAVMFGKNFFKQSWNIYISFRNR